MAERIAARLDEADLAVSGHTLVLLRLKSVAGLRDERTGEARDPFLRGGDRSRRLIFLENAGAASMSAQRGRDLLVRVSNGAGGFVAVAGLRARQLAFNAETVDVTNADSAGRWRELLAGAGVRRAAVAGSGVFRDEASDARLRQMFFDGVIGLFLVVLNVQTLFCEETANE